VLLLLPHAACGCRPALLLLQQLLLAQLLLEIPCS
jgi:hypothetical protein